VDPGLAALIGAAVAGLAALSGATLARRTEHDKWLREKRLEAFASFFALVDEIVVESTMDDLLKAEFAKAFASVELPTQEEGSSSRPTVGRDDWERILQKVSALSSRAITLERSLARARLVGPPELDGRFRALRDVAFEYLVKPEKERSHGLDEVNDLLDGLLRDARAWLDVRARRRWHRLSVQRDRRQGAARARAR
jgi:hypothetical protein